MGVSALHKVLIITFFTVGFVVGYFVSAIWDIAADATRPRAGSSAAIMEMMEVGTSRVYLSR